MRFPSLTEAMTRARQTAARFPLALLSGAVAATALILLIEGPEKPWMPRLMATGLLGLPLFAAIVTTAERRGASDAIRWGASLIAAAGLAGLWFWSRSWPDDQAVLRFLQLGLVAHLAVAVGPFLGGAEGKGFWQFNRILLLRFILAGIFAGALFLGLALALAAVENLFGLDIRNETYPQLWAVMAFVFHPWFMLAGVPEDLDALEQLDEYPLVLKVFAQFILLPLVSLYLVILTVYLGKVVVSGEWPSGWIGWLVSGVSLAGVLALLLLHPVRNREDSTWVNWYGRWYFLALLPALGMLLAAVAQRINQYGMTEPRYFLLVLALWLLGLGLFYVITGARSIRPIPTSLLVVALLAWTGPWSAYAVSRRSQEGRLAGILAAQGMGPLGAVTRPAGSVPRDTVREMSEILSWLETRHGSRAVGAAIGLPPDTLAAWEADRAEVRRLTSGRQVARRAMEHLGLAFELGPVSTDQWMNLSVEHPAVDVAGWQRLTSVGLRDQRAEEVEAFGLVLRPSSGMASVDLMPAGSADSTVVATFLLRPAMDSLRFDRANPFLAAPLIFDAAGGGRSYRLVLVTVHGQASEGAVSPRWAEGFLLIREP